jgi:hypothetical protein
VSGLESLAKIMCIELLELRRERDRALASHTVMGHLTNLLGYALSVFCIARCCSQLPAVQHGPDPDRRLALFGQHAVKPGKKILYTSLHPRDLFHSRRAGLSVR